MDRRGFRRPRRKRNARVCGPNANANANADADANAWGNIPTRSMTMINGHNTRATIREKRYPERVGAHSQPQLLIDPINTITDRDKASQVPEKHVLQLILDILQRRDTYDIFAEPVDPNEVEDYYKIIKEAMDFGTMRAKLHEGMYETLEQFKKDVFLITTNAMHFNSSATIYFRQARAIHELAKRVFHVLETDSRKLELTSSGMRRRISTRSMHKNKSGSVDTNSPSKKRNHFWGSTSTLSRSRERNNNWQGGSKLDDVHAHPSQPNAKISDLLLGTRGGRKLDDSNIESNRRSTYDRNRSPFFQVVSNPFSLNTLKPLEEQDVGYRESLLLFVKELGPMAQKVAIRKLQSGEQLEMNCPPVNQSGSGATSHPKTTAAVPSAAGVELHHENVRPVILALEHPHGKHAGRSRSKRNFLTPKKRTWSGRMVVDTGHERQSLPPPAPGFPFDMCFLKAKLDRMIVQGSTRTTGNDNLLNFQH